jgi:hypothetical protein
MTMMAASIVLSGIMAMVQVTTTQTVRVGDRVQANQLARPQIQRLMDELHSTCVAPDTIPIRSTSNSTTMQFVSRTGNSVAPTPNLHVVSVSGGALTETIYPANGGTAPNWTFSGTATSSRTLLPVVTTATVDGASVPPFRYYRYVGNDISSTPMAVPLDANTAKEVVQVNISLAVGSYENGTRDTRNAVTVSDTAVLRFNPASADTSETNPPCA